MKTQRIKNEFIVTDVRDIVGGMELKILWICFKIYIYRQAALYGFVFYTYISSGKFIRYS